MLRLIWGAMFLIFSFEVAFASGKTERVITCTVQNVVQPHRIIADLSDYPWVIELTIDDEEQRVFVFDSLINQISETRVPAENLVISSTRTKFGWQIPYLKDRERGMQGSYKFDASLDLRGQKIKIWVIEYYSNYALDSVAVASGKCLTGS